MKVEIMRLTNKLVEGLLFCDDEEFVNSVVERVNDGTVFGEDEIEEAEAAQKGADNG